MCDFGRTNLSRHIFFRLSFRIELFRQHISTYLYIPARRGFGRNWNKRPLRTGVQTFRWWFRHGAPFLKRRPPLGEIHTVEKDELFRLRIYSFSAFSETRDIWRFLGITKRLNANLNAWMWIRWIAGKFRYSWDIGNGENENGFWRKKGSSKLMRSWKHTRRVTWKREMRVEQEGAR